MINRVAGNTNATAVNTTGAQQSTGIGVGPVQPKRYAEFTIKARVTFNQNADGAAYVYVYRTTQAIPANGAAPNVGDVIVGGGAFAGGHVFNGVNEVGSLSFLDTGLDVNTQYRYYIAVSGQNGQIVSLSNASQLLVMERS